MERIGFFAVRKGGTTVLEHLNAFLERLEADAALIHRPENIRYLSGYAGEGCLYVSRQRRVIVTDFPIGTGNRRISDLIEEARTQGKLEKE